VHVTLTRLIVIILSVVIALVIADKLGIKHFRHVPPPGSAGGAQPHAAAPAPAGVVVAAPASPSAPAAPAPAETATVSAPIHEAPAETPEVLPDGEHREMVFYRCTACHNSYVVRRQGMARSLWDETISMMVSKHGMPEPDAEERKQILDYLAAALPPVAPAAAGRPGFVNPFAN